MDFVIGSCNRHLNETYRLFYEEELLFKLPDLTTTAKATDPRLQAAIDKYNEDHNKLDFICSFRNIQDEDLIKENCRVDLFESDGFMKRQTFPDFEFKTPSYFEYRLNQLKKMINKFDHLYECSGAVRDYIHRLPCRSSRREECKKKFTRVACKFENMERILNEFEDDRDRDKLRRSFRRIEAEELLANMKDEIYIGRILLDIKWCTW